MAQQPALPAGEWEEVTDPAILGQFGLEPADAGPASLPPGEWEEVTDPAVFEQFGLESPDQMGAFRRSLEATLVGTNPKLFGTSLEIISRQTGLDSLGEWGASLKGMGEEQLQQYNLRGLSIADIIDDPNFDDILTYFGESAGQGFGSMAPSLAVGGAATLMSGGNPVFGFLAGATGPSYFQNLGDIGEGLQDELAEQLKSGKVTQDDIDQAALLGAIPMAALDVVGTGAAALGIIKPAKAAFKRKLMSRLARGLVKGLGFEGLTEGLQETISQLVQTEMSGADFATKERFTEIADNAIAGAIAGGGVGAVGGIRKGKAPPDETEGAGERPVPEEETVPGLDETLPQGPSQPPGERQEPPPLQEGPPKAEPPVVAPVAPPGAVQADTGISDVAPQTFEDEEVPPAPPAPPASTPEEVAVEAAKAEPEPTEAQAKAGNYRHGHIRFQDLDITIETAKGQMRRGKAPDGTPWEVEMPAHYGYIKRTVGADEEQVDVYLGDDTASDRVFVVDQVDPKTPGELDEHKAILGVNSLEEAKNLYDGGFSDGSGPRRRSSVTETTVDLFRKWLNEGETTKRFDNQDSFFVSSNYETARTPRPSGQVALQGVGEPQATVPQPQHPVLPQLRGPGDQGVPGVAGEFPGIPEGGGATPQPETYPGAQGQRRPLRAGERPVGYAEGASPEYAQEPPSDVSGADQNLNRLGRDIGPSPIDTTVSSEPGRNVGRRRAIDPTTGRAAAQPASRDTRGEGIQYHGSPSTVDTLDEGYYTSLNYYGQGFYSTDAFDIARGYSKRRKAKTSTIYQVTEKQPVKFYDMDTTLSPELKKYLKATADRDLGADVLIAMAMEEGNNTLTSVYDEIRATSRDEGYSADDVQENFEGVREFLESQGYGGITHTGGKITDKPAHAVKIYFNPERDIAIRPVSEPAPEPAAEPAPAAPAAELAPAVKSKKATKPQKDADEGLFDVAGRGQKPLFHKEEPTKPWIKKNADIVERVERLAQRIVPTADVKVVREIFSVFDTLTAEEKVEIKEALPNTTGFYLPAKQLIAVALNAKDPIHVLRHEAIHALRDMGMFTNREWGLLAEESQRRWRAAYTIDARYAGETLDIKIEEGVAEAFGHWQRGTQIAPGFRRIFQKIADFLRALGNMLRGYGFNTVASIFKRIELGEVGGRRGRKSQAQQARFHLEDNMSPSDLAAVERMRGKIGAPERSLLDKLKEKVADRISARIKQGVADDLHTLKLAEMAANDGNLYEDSRSAYKLARLTRGIGEVIFHAMYFGAPIWTEGTTEIDTSVKAPMQIMEDLGDRVGDFEVYLAARRAEELMKPTKEFKKGRENLFLDDEVQAALKLAEIYPDFVELAADIKTYNDRLLDFVEQSGLIDEKTRAFFEEMHKNYVPFWRVMENDGKVDVKGPKAKLGFAGQRSGFFKLRGGEANIERPFLNMERNIHRLIEASVKNVVMLRTEQINAELGYAFMKPKARTAKRALVNNKQMIDDLAAQGLEITGEDNVDPDALRVLWSFGNAPQGKNMVTWVRGGRVIYAQVTDTMLFRSLTMLSRSPFTAWSMAPLKGAKRLLTAAVGLDPSFQFANITRDTMHAAVISHIGFKPGIDSMIGFAKTLMKSPEMREMMQAGAGMSSLFEADHAKVHKVLERHLKKGKRGIGPGTVIDTTRGWFAMFERLESTFEYATRVGAFNKLRKDGVPLMEAAYQAREISTDFAMRGEWVLIRFLAETVPFFNAGLQGLYRTGRGAAENPLSFAAKGSLIAIASIALYMINRDDERFRELSEHQRDTYWHFFIGDDHYKIPKPFEVGAIFGSIPERMAELALEKRGKRFSGRLQFLFLEMFRLDPIPQLIRPPARIYSNWDEFRERPVIPQWLEKRQPSEQYDVRTPEVAIEMGRALDVAPKHVETIINGYLGAWGSYLMTAADSLLQITSDRPVQPSIPWQERPVIRRFVGQKVARSTYYLDQMYEMKDEVDKLLGSIQALQAEGDVKRAKELMRVNVNKIAIGNAVEAIANRVRRINRAMRLIRQSHSLSADEKRTRIDDLQLKKNATARKIERLMDRFEGN